MKTSESQPTLRCDVLSDQRSSDHRHSSTGCIEKCNDTTDIVLEYFTPGTRSTTESEILAANADSDGFYSTQAYSRRSGSVGDGKLFYIPRYFQFADDVLTKPATLKRHRAASASPQQHAQRQPQQQQEQPLQQQRCYMVSAPRPASPTVGRVGPAQKAVAVNGVSAEYSGRIHISEHGHNAQRQTQNRQHQTPFPTRATMPIKGTSHPDSPNILRSWFYPVYASGGSKGGTTNENILKGSLGHNIGESQSLLQQMHQNVQPTPRAHVSVAAPASSAETAIAPSHAETPPSGYGRTVPLRIIPKPVVVTRGEEAVLRPPPAVPEAKASMRFDGVQERIRPAYRVTFEHGEWPRDACFITPSVLQRAEPPSRTEKGAQRLPEGIGAAESHTKEEQTFFSSLPFWRRKSDIPTFHGKTQQAKVSTQRNIPFPTDDVRHTTHQQRVIAADSHSSTSQSSFTDVAPHVNENPARAFKHTAPGRAPFLRDPQGRTRPSGAPSVAANLVSPSHRASTVLLEETKQTRLNVGLLHPCEGRSRPQGNCSGEHPCLMRESAPTRVTPNVAAPTAFAGTSTIHRGRNISAQPAAANLWAGFFWKSSPHVRLSSSSSGRESCSTQCSSPRGIIASTPHCADVDSRSKTSTPAASSSTFSPGGGKRGPPATSKEYASPPWRAAAFPSAWTGRREQPHGQQQCSWPSGYYTTASATRQSQRIFAHARQHQQPDEAAKEKETQQPPLSSSGYDQTRRAAQSPLDALAKQVFATPSWLYLYEATRLEVIGVPRGGGATRLLKSAEILLCKTAIAASCPALGARVKEDRNSRQLIFLLPSREVVPVRNVKLLSCISQGSFGTVFRARWEGKTVAVKQAHGCTTLEAMRSVVREVNSFRLLNHPLILKYLGVCLDPNFLGIITEYLPGKSIFEALWDPKLVLTAATRLKLCRQLVEAVNYMHTEKRLVHRDLKTSNLILNGEDGLKLCDFGKTRPLALHGRVRLEDNGGSPRYMAPECFAVGNLIDEKVDVWGLGCCLMEIMGGPIPFENIHSNEGVIQAVTHKQMSPTVPSWFHPSIKTLLQRCFALNPEKRPSAQQILDVLYVLSPEDVHLYGMNARRSI